MAEPFDLDSLTWGEVGMVELASGLTLKQIWKVTFYRLAFITMVSASRSGEPVPSWPSLMSRRVLDVSSSPSPTPPDSPSET